MVIQTPQRPDGAAAPRHRLRGRTILALAAAVLVPVLAVGTAVLLGRSGSSAPSGPTPTASAALPSSGATVSPSGTAATPSPSTSASGPASSVAAFRFLPLWPFASADDAAAWQAAAGPGGHQPWRLDAGDTALAFATTYLGYTEMNRVLSTRTSGDQAWVAVAGTPPEGRATPVAVLHLARIGTGPVATRPWEVVGSQDDTLTLTTPRYAGALLGPGITVGGRITGVDESLAIQVLDRSAGRLALREGITAGGTDQPWTATLAVDTSLPRLVTVAVATGGHLMRVERFAITGAYLRTDPSLAGHATAHAALAGTVTDGTYIGTCPESGAPSSATKPVCSVPLQHATGRFLYRVGYYQTDNGYYTVLTRTGTGRWLVAIPRLPGPEVPRDLGGPFGVG